MSKLNQLTSMPLVSSIIEITETKLKDSIDIEKISQLTIELYKKSEELINQVVEPVKDLIDCKNGCSFCCYNQVSVTPLEVLTIDKYLKENLSDNELNDLKEKIVQTDKITYNTKHLERKKLRMPCPLLKDNSCSVYSVRPLFCRGWNSNSSIDCEDAFNSNEEHEIKIFGSQLMVTNSISIGLNKGIKKLGNKSENLELIHALKIALTKYNVTEKYLSGKNIFSDARLDY
ncbi:MAG: YkgJ family cysteine cluster protein [Candidatus Sericytochromatia bacterium]|nr:YkgJ family cysteine cluster protein [Candidatus Sericytochromatia bacterium]